MIQENDLVYLLVDDYESTHGLFRDKQGVVQSLLEDEDRAVVDFVGAVVNVPLSHIKVSSQNKRSLVSEDGDQDFYSQVYKWNPKDANISSTGSLRYNSGKPEIHQVPSCAIKGIAEVLMYGAGKYSKWNWAKGNNYSVPYDSAMRHLMSFWDGEDVDEESKITI